MSNIDEFFARYEEGANSFDPDVVASQFTDCFMAADPNGVVCLQNDAKLKEAGKERKQFFQDLGFRFARILGKDVVELDRNYAMVKVHWHMKFENPSAKQNDFKFFITYFLYVAGPTPKVAFYISHEDEQKVMEDAGLLPRSTA